MIRYCNILLPTDFSILARHAAPWAKSLAETYGATLHVLHVLTPEVQPFPAPDIGMGVLAVPPDTTQAADMLNRFLDECIHPTCVPITSHTTIGAPVAEIARYARESRIDLIVMGTHARGPVTRMLLGSVSKAVLEHAPCAVLMVPLRAREEGR